MPVNEVILSPTVVVKILTPGATKSGFIYSVALVYPLPENPTVEIFAESYAPTVITLSDVDEL